MKKIITSAIFALAALGGVVACDSTTESARTPTEQAAVNLWNAKTDAEKTLLCDRIRRNTVDGYGDLLDQASKDRTLEVNWRDAVRLVWAECQKR